MDVCIFVVIMVVVNFVDSSLLIFVVIYISQEEIGIDKSVFVKELVMME